jgi:hypothetical protein
MRDLTRLGFCCAAICCSGLVSVATSADMYGHEVNLQYWLQDSPIADDVVIDVGNFTIGDGVEFEHEASWGPLTTRIDFTHDSIIWSWTIDYSNSDGYYWVYSIPALFNNKKFTFLGDSPTIYGASMINLSSSVGWVGDADLWEEVDQKTEAQVDLLYLDPNSPDRIYIDNDATIQFNTQGFYVEVGPYSSITVSAEIIIEFACEGDVDSDGSVDIHDLLALVAAWGDCPEPCSADINEDQVVNIHDLLALVAAWGECP